MQLLDNLGWLLGFCYVVAEVPWVVAMVLLCGSQGTRGQVTFICIALLTIQIVSKHLTVSHWRIECQ